MTVPRARFSPEHSLPSRTFTTANEIHIPVGRKVRVRLTSPDVIHSLWVPNLHGKRDLIPGLENEVVLHADRAGTYRGQCAEYCGAAARPYGPARDRPGAPRVNLRLDPAGARDIAAYLYTLD